MSHSISLQLIACNWYVLGSLEIRHCDFHAGTWSHSDISSSSLNEKLKEEGVVVNEFTILTSYHTLIIN